MNQPDQNQGSWAFLVQHLMTGFLFLMPLTPASAAPGVGNCVEEKVRANLDSATPSDKSSVKVAICSTYVPQACGIATFARDIRASVEPYTKKSPLIAAFSDHELTYDPKSVKWTVPKSTGGTKAYVDMAKTFNQNRGVDVINIEHEFGIYGGDDGQEILTLLKNLKKPAIITLHTILPDPSPNQKRVIQEMAPLSNGFAVMSETGKSLLIKNYGIPAEKITVIPHGVPDVPRLNPQQKNALKTELGIAGKEVIGTFGLVSSGKGIEYMVEAMPKIVEKHPNAVYLVLGETHPEIIKNHPEHRDVYREDLVKRVKELGMEDHVKFVNHYLSMEELIKYLAVPDVFVTPYKNPNQITSGVLSYALGAGRATIATRYLDASEKLADGRGVLVDIDSPATSDQISAAANQLLSDPKMRAAMEDKSYEYMRRATWPEVGKAYTKLFEKARNEGSPNKNTNKKQSAGLILKNSE